MRIESVVDTVILQKANALITRAPREGRLFLRRIDLLKQIRAGTVTVLVSSRLLHEYREHVLIPRNEFVNAFFELLDRPGRVTWNWTARWSGGQRETARKCRYPVEDDHLLRTAIRDGESQILTEEDRILLSDQCIFRQFGVHLRGLP
jgi:hypothetical protein